MLAHLKIRMKSKEDITKETRLWREVNDIDTICTKLGLPYETQQLSVRIYNRATYVREFEHESLRNILIGVTIYCGCKLSKINCPVIDICAHAKITVTELRKGHQIFLNNWDYISGVTDKYAPRDKEGRFPNYKLQPNERIPQSSMRQESSVSKRSSPTQLQLLLQQPPPNQLKRALNSAYQALTNEKIANGNLMLKNDHQHALNNQIRSNCYSEFPGGQILQPNGLTPKLMDPRLENRYWEGTVLENCPTPFTIRSAGQRNVGTDPHPLTNSCNATRKCHLMYSKTDNSGMAQSSIVATCVNGTIPNGIMNTNPKTVTNPFKIPVSHQLKRDLITASNMIRDSVKRNQLITDHILNGIRPRDGHQIAPHAQVVPSHMSGTLLTRNQIDSDSTSGRAPSLAVDPNLTTNSHIPITPNRPFLWKRRRLSPTSYEGHCSGEPESKLRAIQNDMSRECASAQDSKSEPLIVPTSLVNRNQTRAVMTKEQTVEALQALETTSNRGTNEANGAKTTHETNKTNEKILTHETNTTNEGERSVTSTGDPTRIQSVNYHSKLYTKPKVKLAQLKLTIAHAPWHVRTNFSDRTQGINHSDYHLMEDVSDNPFEANEDSQLVVID